jgi:hypothetical protein
VTIAVRGVSDRLRPVPVRAGVAAATLVAIAGWNLAMANDYIRLGRHTGDDIGGTVRYVERHRDIPGERFYLAADQRFPYFVWSMDDMGVGRIQFAAHPSQVSRALGRHELGNFSPPAPFSLFINRDLWDQYRRAFTLQYPAARVHKITPDGRLVAVEVA